MPPKKGHKSIISRLNSIKQFGKALKLALTAYIYNIHIYLPEYKIILSTHNHIEIIPGPGICT